MLFFLVYAEAEPILFWSIYELENSDFKAFVAHFITDVSFTAKDVTLVPPVERFIEVFTSETSL